MSKDRFALVPLRPPGSTPAKGWKIGGRGARVIVNTRTPPEPCTGDHFALTRGVPSGKGVWCTVCKQTITHRLLGEGE